MNSVVKIARKFWIPLFAISASLLTAVIIEYAEPGALTSSESSSERAAHTLPSHVIADDSPVPPRKGHRVQINSQDTDLTKEECRALINAYRHRAAPDGQVSVRKPSQAFNGQLTPWCIENFDGQGIRFNDNMF